MKKYKHIISLGFFCSTALELERIGLRDSSSPFDWLISDFKGVIECIDNGFDDLLNYDNISQYKEIPQYYVDNKYNLHFYHDFSGYASLMNQLPKVQEKYRRRIDRFYKNIKEPTLFLYYIKDMVELEYIERDYSSIISILKKSNSNNNLILISNEDITSQSLYIYYVKKDDTDSVARVFLEKNKELNDYLCSDIYDSNKRQSNINRFKSGIKKKKLLSYSEVIISKVQRKLLKKYIHSSTC
ncbi:MAG: cysteine protease [Bacillales bacterium]|jgi:hypothetical protein|nr:cysteine protease [Bacillales bacterium]